MAHLTGKVAFITGAARGQGRAHAVRFAEEGADVIALDLCEQIPSVEYQMSSKADIEETERLIIARGRRALCRVADVRDADAVRAVVADGVAAFGRLDFIVANAGIMATTGPPSREMQAWTDSIDVMLTGVFNTLQACVPYLVDGGNGGSIVITSSTSGLRGVAYDLHLLTPGQIGYGAAKHGVIGVMRNYAKALGPHGIRVNTVHPMGVRTPMVVNEFFSSVREGAPPGWMANAMQLDLLEPEDISSAVIWLCSDESRFVTGTELTVDAGQLL